MVSDADRGYHLYLDTERFLANPQGVEASGVAIDLITRVWWPAKSAFVFNEETLATRFASELPTRGYTADFLRHHRSAIASFFTILADGRWVPNPEYFSITDG